MIRLAISGSLRELRQPDENKSPQHSGVISKTLSAAATALVVLVFLTGDVTADGWAGGLYGVIFRTLLTFELNRFGLVALLVSFWCLLTVPLPGQRPPVIPYRLCRHARDCCHRGLRIPHVGRQPQTSGTLRC